jgi:hypothetical protein
MLAKKTPKNQQQKKPQKTFKSILKSHQLKLSIKIIVYTVKTLQIIGVHIEIRM